MIWEWCFIEIPSSWTVGTTGFPSHQRLVSSWFMVPHGSSWFLGSLVSIGWNDFQTYRSTVYIKIISGLRTHCKTQCHEVGRVDDGHVSKNFFLKKNLVNLHLKVFVYNSKFKLFDRIKRCLNDVPVESSTSTTSMSSLKSFFDIFQKHKQNWKNTHMSSLKILMLPNS